MKTSNRPQTIAVVKSQVDIQSFRSNPEWYEIKEEEVISPVSKPDKPVVTKPRKKE
jgi:hypothetical protein